MSRISMPRDAARPRSSPSKQAPVPLREQIHRRLFAFTAGWKGRRVAPESLMVGMNTTGSRPPIYWCLQGFRELSQLAKHLGEEQPIYGLRSGHLVVDYTEEDILSIAAYYVEEILAAHPDGPCAIGGNCQGTLISFEIARQLRARGKPVILLCLLDYYGPEPYSGKVALYFAHGSINNPYRYYRWPERAWDRLFSGGYSIDFVAGIYGVSFNEPHIGQLAEHINTTLARARRETVDPTPKEPWECALPLSAYRARISAPEAFSCSAGEQYTLGVEVQNMSAVTWPNGGIALANRWLDEQEDVARWVDGRVELPHALCPGEILNMELQLCAPQRAGSLWLELDLVEEGLTWFMDRDSTSTRVRVDVSANEQVEPLSGESSVAHWQAGSVYFGKGDMHSAVLSYRRALELDPLQPLEVFQNLGDALVNIGQYYEAIDVFQNAMTLEMNSAGLHFKLAGVLQKLGHLEEAVDCYRESLALNPEHPVQVYQPLGETLEHLEQYRQAVEVYRKAIVLEAVNPQLISALARSHHELGEHEEVLRLCREGLDVEPDNPNLYYLKADTELEMGAPDAALADFNRAIALGLNGAWPHKRIGDLFAKKGDLKGSIEAYKRGVDADPGNPHIHFSLGESYHRQANWTAARESYQRAIELDPTGFWPLKNMADVLLELDEIEAAISCYHDAIELNPNIADIYHGLGWCHNHKGNYDLAISYCHRALTLDPKNAWTFKNLGDAHLEKRQFGKALFAYIKALRLAPGEPHVRACSGRWISALFRKGK